MFAGRRALGEGPRAESALSPGLVCAGLLLPQNEKPAESTPGNDYLQNRLMLMHSTHCQHLTVIMSSLLLQCDDGHFAGCCFMLAGQTCRAVNLLMAQIYIANFRMLALMYKLLKLLPYPVPDIGS